MLERLQDPISLLAATSVFAFVLAVWTIGMLLLSSRAQAARRRLHERLRGEGTAPAEARVLRLWHEGDEVTTVVPTFVERTGLLTRLGIWREEAGFEATVGALALRVAGAALVAGSAGYLTTGRVLPAVLLALLVPIAFGLHASRRIARRRSIVEQQLVDGLELSARALRAGHPLMGAFRLIAEEVPAPIGRIFAEIVQQQEMGTPVDEALRRAAAKSGSADLRLFTASIAVNLQTGGNLAEVIEGIAKVVRARIRLHRRFRVLTAQTQFSKRILLLLPALLFLVIHLMNPEYAGELYRSRAGALVLASAAGMLLVGWWLMNRMSAIEA